jgi:antitoxin MazE
MKANIIRIGNSRGLRLPKAVLRQCRLEDTVELEVEDDRVVIRSARKARSGWDEAFAEMTAHGDDSLRDAGTRPTEWDKREWRWCSCGSMSCSSRSIQHKVTKSARRVAALSYLRMR